MPAPSDWPEGVPFRILEEGATAPEGETAIRSETDSGFARQRAAFTSALNEIAGNIRMTWAQYVQLRAFRQGLGGSTFNWPGYVDGSTVEARFVAGAGNVASKDPKTAGKFLVSVRIEIMP